MDWDRLARALRSNGVQRVFGVPGTQVVPLLEAIRNAGIPFHLAAHEAGAAFMANGYARATGGTGVLITIGGPGFTNTLTGLAEARQDSAGVLLITSAPEGAAGERFALQALDQQGVANPIVKGSFRLSPDADAAIIVPQALHRTQDGEPGPVLLEVGGRGAAPSPSPDPVMAVQPFAQEPFDRDALLQVVADRWCEARRPIVYAGQGVAAAAADLRVLVERHGVPVLTTPSGRGVLDESHPLAMGFDPLRGGVEVANHLLQEADLVLILGAKLSHNGCAGFALRFPPDRTVHVDRDPTVPGARYPCSLQIASSAEAVVERLLAAGSDRGGSEWVGARLREAREALRTPAPDPTEPRLGGPLGGGISDFFEWLAGALPPEAILTTDSGQHQVMTRRHFTVRSPRGLLLPSDLQSMGFGLPAAIGAKLAVPDRPVAVLLGDGGFLMSGMELTTAVREHLAMPVIVFSDGYLNQIRLQQLRGSGHTTGVDLGGLSIEAFSYAVGAEYVRFDPNMSPEVLGAAFRRDGPTVLEVPIGDNPGLARVENRARLKTLARRIVGPGGIRRVKRWLGRG